MSTVSPKLSASPLPGKTLRIVHVDDVPQLREVIRLSLGRDGHAVDSFADGASALAHIKANPGAIDLFISDHHMPRMNGLEVVHELRRISYGGRIFIFSSEIDHEVNDEYLALRVDEVLPKPILLPELRQLLADYWPAGT
ncbi:MAG TPA: response regulator [Opitutaceae bacterium]|nr:response regulator [Opitutaceae bacterium]